MSGSQVQVARLLSLVPYLQQHDGAHIDEVAEAFGVTAKQLRKDLQILYWCGLPELMPGDYIEIDLDAVDGHGTIHLSNADYFARPMRFTPDEAVALVLALRSLREVADPARFTVIDSLLEKLSAAAGDRAEAANRTQVRVSGGREEVRGAIHRALEAGVRLDLTYDVASRAETTRRLVDPLRTSLRDGYAYLDAWCHTAGGLRSFRLDRIVTADVTDEPVEDHPGVVLPDPDAPWFADVAEAPLVRLTLAPQAHWIAEYHPVEDAVPGDDGDLLVTLRVVDQAWFRALLLRLGAGVRAVDPPELAETAAERATETLDLYAALGLA
ncbi:helix-turn-helix transcriptional regulator [Propionibacteriaceae bacterium Y1700]|uniref:helix-turn-helix transcriptional regulator n=1 Tax=Microlunatus sp. Y1700 TaxID=3418487 RepID=UPI003DA6ECED